MMYVVVQDRLSIDALTASQHDQRLLFVAEIQLQVQLRTF